MTKINFEKLYKELETLNNKLESELMNCNSKKQTQHELMNQIEKIQTKIYSNKDLYYPNILDPKFAEKLYYKDDFNLFKINKPTNKTEKLLKDYKKLNESKKIKLEKPVESKFKLTKTQIMLKNFMSKHSLYRSLLIFHGTGVGKTYALQLLLLKI